VIAAQSVSLDGFSAGPNVAVGNGMGDGGERLHEWMSPDFRADLLRTGHTGAVVVGRRMFDVGVEPWGDDPPFHMPVFVVTHRAHDPLVKLGGTTYHFVTGGIEEALAQAKATAGNKDVGIFGGADIIRQYVRAGLVDELRIHLVPVLLGDGTTLFDRTATAPIELERTRTIDAPGVTHLIFRMTKSGAGS
jgi:dihydrofolate reductase